MKNPRLQVVAEAAKYVGVREESKNRFTGISKLWDATDYTDGWRNREPYCAAFVAFCVARARIALPDVFLGVRCKSASVAGWRKWARGQNSGCLLITGDPEPGDIVSFLPRLSHIGIVEGYDKRLRVVDTIEGNTDASGGRDGDGIWRRVRNRDFCGEFYRLRYRKTGEVE